MQLSRQNNFDIIRLLAALQVVYVHATKHLHWPASESNSVMYYVSEFIERFPGVPIFFVVSGFLVYWSLERNKDNLRRFFKNRVLRIFPGLWFCIIITIALFFVFNIIDIEKSFSKNFIVWVLGQISFFQFYTPDLLREFGVGTPNGSLWTITVELQFYLLLPILFILIHKFKRLTHKNLCLLSIVLLSLVFAYFIKINYTSDTLIGKLGKVNILTYLYNFVFGIMIFINWDYIKKYIINKAVYWILLYVIYVVLFYFVGNLYGKGYVPNLFGIIGFFILSVLTISVAYSKPNISKFLRGNDISYGVYIYHMLVINTLIELNINTKLSFLLTFVLTVLFGFISWKVIEKPSLRFKNKW